ncbi:unannotated protein [freshwater metagenome]|uniref:Unannotated protein n=1 Tax=freshwater metagenome TaxID=449393 RepID=A0A6J7E6G1_9ZZZZ
MTVAGAGAGCIDETAAPTMSTTTCGQPPLAKSVTRWLSEFTFTQTPFATTCPARKFKFDAVGGVARSGNAVTYPEAFGETTVMLSNTAVASNGTPLPGTPAIVTAR